MPNLLETYKKKRNFKSTNEPSGKIAKALSKKPVFVIQKHAARRLHYDFRLEDEGVLKSWAVPKGPSLDPRDRRLAMQTEDHPMDYAKFEGIIPDGNYGAGRVIVWDYGTFVNLSHDPKTKKIIPLKEGIRRGHANFWLKGKKLQGAFVLTRLHNAEESKPAWLLMKIKDQAASKTIKPVETMPASVFKKGLTIENMKEGKSTKRWKSNRE